MCVKIVVFQLIGINPAKGAKEAQINKFHFFLHFLQLFFHFFVKHNNKIRIRIRTNDRTIDSM